jgi:hypothetical protein
MPTMRPMNFSEMKDKQKIELLKDEVLRLQESVVRLAGYIDQLINHKHLDGKIVNQIKNPNEESYGSVLRSFGKRLRG